MSNQEMSVEERNLISVAYKNAVGSRRASWRIISSVEQKEASKGNEQNVEMAKAYRIRVEAELNRICGEILELIDTNLVPMSTAGESKVFYFKMKGDYFRYIAEFTEGEGKSGAANAAHGAYNQAMEVATTDLVVTHPIRLGLALNFSVFHYEVRRSSLRRRRAGRPCKLDRARSRLYRGQILQQNMRFAAFFKIYQIIKLTFLKFGKILQICNIRKIR